MTQSQRANGHTGSEGAPEIIHMHPLTRQIYIGIAPLPRLSALQHSVLSYFLRSPWVYLTKTEIVESCWKEKDVLRGVTDDSLYQVIRHLRAKLNDKDRIRIISWVGIPEGGYYFQPTGKPRLFDEIESHFHIPIPPSAFTPPPLPRLHA